MLGMLADNSKLIQKTNRDDEAGDHLRLIRTP
jgi:hypothetical protein